MIISQYGMAGGHPQRSHPQMLTDQSMCRFLFLSFSSYRCQMDKYKNKNVTSHGLKTYHIQLSTVLVAFLAYFVENLS